MIKSLLYYLDLIKSNWVLFGFTMWDSLLAGILTYVIFSVIWWYLFNQDTTIYKYKITSFAFTSFTIILYVFTFLYLICIIRITYLDRELDIKNIYFMVKYLVLFTDDDYSLFFIIYLKICVTIILMFIISIIIVIYHVFKKECKKGYLYFLYDGSQQSNSLKSLLQDFTLEGIYNKIIVDNFIRNIITIFNLSNKLYFKLVEISKFFIFKFPSYFMLFYFSYEIIFNDMILSKTFNKLLFWFLFYSLWQRLSSFHWNNDFHINTMLANMYYRQYSIKYVNLPSHWENIIKQYVTDDLCRCKEKCLISSDEFDLNLGLNRILIIQQNYTFHSTDGILYINANKEYFIEKKKADKDIYPKSYP